ncbi:MAG: M48 family metallopeptidase [Chloroherpetonaceae bacterium]|nr:M48 family metallopeptidase [Chloroherpetonaceae bacterium]MCS7211071.1 M48 family metallopeptidase [Chloroherpetonaceae bacterium]MDW8464972.1 M48 family metallopeptidase [Chloroherpetonaceae bacterium]
MPEPLEWQGVAQLFHRSASTPERIVLRIAPSGLHIEKQDAGIDLPVGSFQVSEQPNTEFVKITAEALGDSVVMLSDRAGIAVLERNGFFKASREFKTPFYLRTLIFFGVLAALGVLFFTLGINALVSYSAARVPPELERALGEAALNDFLRTERLEKDSAADATLRKCATLIRRWHGDTALHLKIMVVENRQVKNAFALPGGYIVLYRGILDSIRSESELFGLLAHEAGHVALRHGSKRLLRSALFAVTLSIAFGDVQGLSGILLSQSSNLLDLSYSRSEELEADEFALQILQTAGLDARALPRLLERIGSSSFEIPSVLSTHPSQKERAALAQKVSATLHPKSYLSPEEWNALFQRPFQKTSQESTYLQQ